MKLVLTGICLGLLAAHAVDRALADQPSPVFGDEAIGSFVIDGDPLAESSKDLPQVTVRFLCEKPFCKQSETSENAAKQPPSP